MIEDYNKMQENNLYSILKIYLNAYEEVDNGIYDPIEYALQEIFKKYIIIER